MTTPTLNERNLNDALTRQAAHAGHADIDVTTVLALGAQKRRRRRGFTVAGVGAVAASLVAGAALAPQIISPTAGEESMAAGAPSGSATRAPVVYMTDEVVRLDGVEVPLPGKAEQLVPVDTGAVLLAEGTVWWVRAGMDLVELGTYADSPIPGGVRAYGNGQQVGWITVAPESSVVQVVDLDSEAREVVRVELPALVDPRLGGDQTPNPLTLDGDDAYVQDHSGIRKISLSDPDAEPEVLRLGEDYAVLQDVENGQIMWHEGITTWMGSTWGDGEDIGVQLGLAMISPGGRYATGDGPGNPSVVELATGRHLQVLVNTHNDMKGSAAWISEDTFVVHTHPEPPRPWQFEPMGQPVLWSCTVPDTGTDLDCERLPEIKERGEVVFSATNVF